MTVTITEFEWQPEAASPVVRAVDLGTGLNVAVVRDAAWELPLLRLVPWVFFGGSHGTFPRARAAPGQPAVAAAGTLRLRTERGVVCVRRTSATPLGDERYVTAADGPHCDAGDVHRLLQGTTAATFREVFTLDPASWHRRLRNAVRARQRMVRLAAYLVRRSPAARPVLAAQATGPQAAQRTSAVQDMERGLADLGHDLAEAVGQLRKVTARPSPEIVPSEADGARDRTSPRDELQRLDGELLEVQDKLRHVEAETARLYAALAANRLRLRLQQLDHEMSGIRPAAKKRVPAPSETARRLDEKLAECREQQQELVAERDELRKQVRELGSISRTARWLPHVEALLLQEKSLLKEESALEQLEQRIGDMEAEREAQRSQLSQGPGTAHIRSLSDGHLAAQVDLLGERLLTLERERQEAEERLTRATAAGPAPMATADPVAAGRLQEASDRLHDLRERLGHHDQLTRLLRDREDLEHQVQRLYTRQLMPFRVQLALGVPFVVGVGMIIFGLVMGSEAVQWRMVMLGFIAAMTTTVVKMTMDRGTGELLQSARRRISGLDFQIEEIRGALQKEDVSPEELEKQVEQAEQELQRWRQHAAASAPADPSPARWQGHDEATSASWTQPQAELQQRIQQTQQQWRDLMIQLQLPSGSTPAQAKGTLSARAAASQASVEAEHQKTWEWQRQQLAAELARRKEWLASMAAQARNLVKELGYGQAGSSLGEALELLRETVVEHKEKLQARRQLSRSLARLKQRYMRLRQTRSGWQAQREKLRAELQKRQEQQEWQAKFQAERLQRLEQQRDELCQELASLRGQDSHEEFSPLEEWSDAQLAERLEQQTESLRRLIERLTRLSEQRGMCRARQEQDGSETLTADIAATSIDWDGLLLKCSGLQRVCQQQRLPLTQGPGPHYRYLDLAAAHLRRLTRGRFTGILWPAEGQLCVIDHQGRTRDVCDLKRQHLADLDLSLWCARVGCFADAGVQLPILVGDLLRAASPAQQAAVAGLFCHLGSMGHQILLITSRRETARTFSGWDVPTAVLPEPQVPVLRDSTMEAEPLRLDAPAADRSTLPREAPDSAGAPLFPRLGPGHAK